MEDGGGIGEDGWEGVGEGGKVGERVGEARLGSKVIINIILGLNWKVEVPFN